MQFSDYILQFAEWLKQFKKYNKRTIGSRISNIKLISESYNLLKEFVVDECQAVLEDLKFSKDDIEPKTDIIINGNYYNGLATYRQTVRLFVEFLKDIDYKAPTEPSIKCEKFVGSMPSAMVARFIGDFDDFKRYIGPKCKNNVNAFCKKERDKHNRICEWCGEDSELQSAHIKERLTIIKEILDADYRIADNWYDVNIDEFLLKFRNAHFPIEDHIFFLCKKCHDKLDVYKTISVDDIKNKRSGK